MDFIKEKELKESKIIPLKGEIIGIGNNWFKDQFTGICYHIKRLEDNKLIVEETRQSTVNSRRLKVPKLPIMRHILIYCKKCKSERVIKVQDRFQVTLCMSCQHQFRLQRRRECRAEAKLK